MEQDQQPDGQPSLRYAWGVVGLLGLAYTFSFIDRQILSLMVGPIRQDLGLTDTGVSLLHGLAFVIFYTTMGYPLGRLADRAPRKWIISTGIAVWSLMTALCGLARNFIDLFLARVGVGVGEATLSPAAYSMISDYFPREKIGRAMGVYNMGVYLGSGLAFIVGGAVIEMAASSPPVDLPLFGETRPWQLAFFIVGLPGLLVALAVMLVREPARRNVQTPGRSFADGLRFIRGRARVYAPFICGTACMSFIGYATNMWLPSFFMRVHGLSTGEAGLYIGLVVLVGGMIGVFGGGWVADWLQARGRRDAFPLVIMGSALGVLVPSLLIPFMPTPLLAFLVYIPASIFTSAPFAAAPAALQVITPNEMRGQVSAVYLMVTNIIGLGLGPTAVALVTDYLFADPQKVGYSVALITAMAAPLGVLLLSLSRAPFAALAGDGRDPVKA